MVETLDKYFENVCELDVSGHDCDVSLTLSSFFRADNVQHREGALYNRRDGDERVHCGD